MGRKYCRTHGGAADDRCADRRAAPATAVIAIAAVIAITAAIASVISIAPVNSASSDAAVVDLFNLYAVS
jgi:hypothetical protein